MNLAARLAEAVSFGSGPGEPRGFPFSAPPSLYLDRARAPEETVARMRPRFAEFGVTRLARITGLDRIGIPVWSAIRPNSRSLATAQGKGLDDAAAQASAVMEAVEVAVAEREDWPSRACSADDLAAGGQRTVFLSELLRAHAAPLEPDEVVDWIEGYDLLRKEAVWIPLDAVTFGARGAASRYWRSTDGLASGNTLWEAAIHGLCERIERDALALWSLRDDAHLAARCRDPRQFEDPELNRLTGLIEAADLQLRLFDISSDLVAPVFLAIVSLPPDGREDKWRHFDLSSGSGCHPHALRAALRAVTEAAQTRLTTISAARDDFDPDKYETKLNASLLPYLSVSPNPERARSEAPRLERSGYLGFLLQRLAIAGVGSAIVVPLESGDPDYAVVKVLVPELESPPGDRRALYGKRAIRAMAAARR